MLCTRCQKNTAKYAVKYKGESTPSAHLCADCYMQVKKNLVEQETEDRTCPNCGSTISEYLRTGLVGCPQCYSFFAEELNPYILRLQASGTHRGSRPLNPFKYQLANELRETKSLKASAELLGEEELVSQLSEKINELRYALFVDGGDDEGV